MSPFAFDKYEGLGNDFVLVEAADVGSFATEDARALCDRRFGVGGDGVLVVSAAREAGADARMKVVNADGSVPEMCGNGLRCAALHVARKRGLTRAELLIETDAGPKRCAVEDFASEPPVAENGAARVAMVTVDMGVVRVDAELSLEIDGEWIDFVTADAGNPHAVTFGKPTREALERVGPVVATHARFPHGTNVEIAEVGPTGIDVRVWERGVGPTLACGTGACATLAVAVARGLATAGEWVLVRLPGGALQIRIDAANGRVTMRGPARHVFSGRSPEAR